MIDDKQNITIVICDTHTRLVAIKRHEHLL